MDRSAMESVERIRVAGRTTGCTWHASRRPRLLHPLAVPMHPDVTRDAVETGALTGSQALRSWQSKRKIAGSRIHGGEPD
jgi:hypothetical protein